MSGTETIGLVAAMVLVLLGLPVLMTSVLRKFDPDYRTKDKNNDEH